MKIPIPVDGSQFSDAAVAFIAARPFKREQQTVIDLLNDKLPVPPRASRRVARLRPVAITMDGSEYGAAAVRHVLTHRTLFGVRPACALVHVAKDGARSEGARIPAPSMTLLSEGGFKTSEQTVVGDPAVQLSRFARNAQLDMLVMGSHGRRAMTSGLLGSVAWRVAATCATPLLLIRKP